MEKKLVTDLVPEIVEEQKQISAVKVIVHPASFNWRQENVRPDQHVNALAKGLKQSKRPEVEIERKDVLNGYDKVILEIIEYFRSQVPNVLVSLSSQVVLEDRKLAHIPTMNYHPEGVEVLSNVGKNRVIELLRHVAKWQVSLCQSDRYWHSYGHGLMNQREFNHWLGLHSNATSLVSPRYIGQSLRDGYTPVRQTANSDQKGVKNTVPYLVDTLEPNDCAHEFWGYKEIGHTTLSRSDLRFKWKIIPE